MRVLVLRSASDGAASARKLQERGHSALLAPLIRFEPLDYRLPDGDWAALLATSAQAFAALREGDRARLARHPVYAVGARTAQAARNAGFGDVRQGAGDAAGLAQLLLKDRKPDERLLYLAGETRKPELETAFAAQGRTLALVETYRTLAVAALPPEAVAALERDEIDAILHYSQRSAVLFRALAEEAAVWGAAAKALNLCLSADVAAGLGAMPRERCSIAARPEEDALLAMLPSAAA